MATAEEVLDLLDLMREWYGAYANGQLKFNPSERASALWVDDLKNLPVEVLFLAFKQHRNQHDWPPQPKHLQDLARLITASDLPTHGDAWGEVIDQIKAVGNWREPTFSHPLIAEAVRQMGGWKLMCAMDIDQTETNRAQFRDIFNALRARVEQDARLLPEVRALRDTYAAALPAPSETAPASVEGFKTLGQVLRIPPVTDSEEEMVLA